ncbi:MAG: hypothetical protein A2Y40_08085 [Candidatus Margulisbacteria bacterium GWF2_35_9]|nr:MAG: hypothetical protein A2Y40_08085 [Candidatus Margulisbacteria bacterium GWF2_35_9]
MQSKPLHNLCILVCFLVNISFGLIDLKQSTDCFIYMGGVGGYFFDRYRLDGIETHGDISIEGIIDFESIIGSAFVNSSGYKAIRYKQFSLPFVPYFYYLETDNVMARIYVYRLYAKYQMTNSSLDVGFQRIPFGVGRLWNPTDKYNPVNALSMEPSERLGVFGINYINYLSDLSVFQVITNFKRELQVDKVGLKYKSFLFGMDIGLSYIRSQDFIMNGIELETNVLETGIEARTELAYIDDFYFNRRYTRGIIGIDYAFPFMLNLAIEYFYNGLGSDNKLFYDPTVLHDDNWNLAKHYLGLVLSYSIDPLTSTMFSSIFNLVDGSWFSGITLAYSLNDNANFAIGSSLYFGDYSSEFGSGYKSSYYFKMSQYF